MRSIDLHAAGHDRSQHQLTPSPLPLGEPARVIIAGVPHVAGESMLEKRNTFVESFDHIRKFLLQEPRGYPCQNANIIFPSSLPECLFGFIILEQNKIYPLMSGQHSDVTLSP
jgi:proline racemase